MDNKRSAAADVIRHLLSQYPDAPAKTIARTAYREHPELWTDLEACRTMVRYYLGQLGNDNRGNGKDKTFHRPARKAGWSDVIPEAITQLGDWGAVEIAGKNRSLILADIHIPFHAVANLEIALEYGEKFKPTLILLNGDAVDHYALSRWETDPKLRDFPAEVRALRQFLKGLRSRFPKARILYKQGNHEERFERYLRFKAPELLGLPEFEWSNVMGLVDAKVEMVGQKRPIRLGKLNVIHGHEYVFNISNPVNPARGLFLRGKTNSLCGHFHQTSNHSEKNLEQKVVSCWSTGCLCDLNPEYRPLNNWNAGAALVETAADGSFHVDNFRIIKGKCY